MRTYEEKMIEALDLAEMGLTAEQAYKIGKLAGNLMEMAYSAGRVAAAEDVNQMPTSLGDEGWSALADQAEEAGYERRVVLRRRRPEDNFTALTIEAAYQYGYRQASKVARGVTRPYVAPAPAPLPPEPGPHLDSEGDPCPCTPANDDNEPLGDEYYREGPAYFGEMERRTSAPKPRCAGSLSGLCLEMTEGGQSCGPDDVCVRASGTNSRDNRPGGES